MADYRKRKKADDDSVVGYLLRWSRHPLRALAMSLAVFCLVADIAMTPGIISAVLGAVSGVFVGEVLGQSRVRLPIILGSLFAFAITALGLGWLVMHAVWVVEIVGTGGALKWVAFLHYGGIAFAGIGAMRALAVRKPGFLSLELAFVVVGVAAALAAHRHGVIARPLWLSDFAWRRGLDPVDILFAFGIAAALLSISLLLFERKGRLSFAALPLLPLLAMLGVSCLEVTERAFDPAEASPDQTDEEGDPPNDTEGDGHSPDNDRSGDGGGGPDGTRDGGAGGGGGDDDGGGGGGSRDGGTGGGRGLDGGGDGGGAGGGGDGGTGGGSSSADGGGGSGSEDGGFTWQWDAGLDETELPPPDRESGDGTGQQDGPPPQDLFEMPENTGEGSASPVAIVLFEQDYSPPSGAYYFRQDAWSRFSGSRLVPATLPEADRDIAGRFPSGRLTVAPPPEAGRAPVQARVALLVEESAPFALEWPVWFREARNPNPNRFRRMYTFFSRSQSAEYQELVPMPAGNPEWSNELLALYLEQNPDERFAELAAEIVGDMRPEQRESAFARAVAIKIWLDARLTYSTSQRHADAEDPTAEFLFGNRIGYCVHFAHAAVYLWRAVGIPSRIGVGFHSAESNRQSGSALLIRSGDAHAWPELYLDPIGWVVLDISAAENLDPSRPAQDIDMQQMLAEMAREEPPDPEDEVRDRPEDRGPPFPWGWTLLVAFLSILGAILLALYLYKLWRRVAPRFAGTGQVGKASYRQALDRLAEAGVVREYGETREQFADRVKDVSPTFGTATELVLAEHFGAADAPSFRATGDDARWHTLRRSVHREVRENTKLWRRVLGLIHPTAFLDAR